jgi:hypothetical protein
MRQENPIRERHYSTIYSIIPSQIAGQRRCLTPSLQRVLSYDTVSQGGRFCRTTVITVYTMKELLLHLPDHAYEQLVMEAAAAEKSPEQWLLDRLFAQPPPLATVEPHTLLAAALDALGFQRLEPEKARRLSMLLEARKARALSHDEADELRALMTEAEALEIEGLQRLTAAVQR